MEGRCRERNGTLSIRRFLYSPIYASLKSYGCEGTSPGICSNRFHEKKKNNWGFAESLEGRLMNPSTEDDVFIIWSMLRPFGISATKYNQFEGGIIVASSEKLLFSAFLSRLYSDLNAEKKHMQRISSWNYRVDLRSNFSRHIARQAAEVVARLFSGSVTAANFADGKSSRIAWYQHRQTVGQTGRTHDPLIVSHSRKCGVLPADKRADEVGWHFDPRSNTSFGSGF